MENLNNKNNQRIIAVIAIFFIFSFISNIYYYNTGREIDNENNSGSNSVVYANEYSNIEQVNVEEIEENVQTISEEQVAYNNKVSKIKKYLSSRGAPLADYAEEFVKAAEYYGIDYRLVAAISIVESSGGKYTFKPYNAWGWGKSGFESWTDGIWTVSKGLAKYYSLGMTTPQSISKSYCPPSADSWASKVSYIMNVISNQ
ncbi:MAG: hypothetical protein PHP08_03175 [Candidatus Dojkabacteria bacterium]|nr:hypothetical protein [Candidatus Dojkabacteria bacterium]